MYSKLTGPYHDFWLLDDKQPYSSYKDYLSRKDAPVRIEDDLLRYFGDYLVWIPTVTPIGKVTFGFDYHGPTIVNKNGAKVFSEILGVLRSLYRLGPKEIIFTGSFGSQLDENEEPIGSGDYEKYIVSRDKLCEVLSRLYEFGQHVSNDSHYILHLGI